MNKTQLKDNLSRLIIEYQNNLYYMRNNPNISAGEVQEHYKVIKQIATVKMLLKER